MKRILKFLLVFIIIFGIGFFIFKIVNNKTSVNMNTYFISQEEKIDGVYDDIALLKTQFNHESVNFETYSRFVVIFESFKNDFEYYENYLTSTSLTKNDENSIKNSFEKFEIRLTELDEAIKILTDYMLLPGADKNEISERELKVDNKFKGVIIEGLNLDDVFANIVEKNVFNGKCFDAGFNLIEIRNVMIKSFLEKGSNFSFVNSVNTKINKFFAQKQKLNLEMKNFVSLFKKYSQSEWKIRFNEYFEHNEVVSTEANVLIADFNRMLEILNLEAFYEKV